jgi:hypothetical protein
LTALGELQLIEIDHRRDFVLKQPAGVAAWRAASSRVLATSKPHLRKDFKRGFDQALTRIISACDVARGTIERLAQFARSHSCALSMQAQIVSRSIELVCRMKTVRPCFWPRLFVFERVQRS